MKKVNKFLIVMLIAFMALPVLNSCKKGADDPGISLKSRKSRLVGEWTLESGTKTYVMGGTTATMTYTNTMVTISYGGSTDTYQYTEKVEFMKDNSFKTTIMYDGDLEVTEGYWTFMDGYDEIKNKECIVIRVNSYLDPGGSTLFTGDQMPASVLRFRKLSSKETIIDAEGTETSGGSTYSYTSTMTYSKK
jgi:hypothetical protein